MINLFHLNEHIINSGDYSNLLHDKIVDEFEGEITSYVDAKYAVTFNSATSAIFLALQNKNITIRVPSMIPPVVLNAIITSGNDYEFTDDIDWVGDSYVLHDFGDYKIVDSAQKLQKGQFKKECNDDDLMVFSFYPTKPVGSCDGGMIVSNNWEKIKTLKEIALNGMTYSHNNWERKIQVVGYKMYMNSIQADIALRNFKLYPSKLNELSRVRSLYNKELGLNNTSDHLYRINVDDRVSFMGYMKANGVGTGIHYEASHLHPVYKKLKSICPLSEENAKKTISIPFNERLTNSDILFIIKLIKEFNDKQNREDRVI
jgi:dTDP-4-amino-4,6-dideoxygalactose transaminase